MSRSQEYVLCASCGREWAPRRPDSQKLICPACGKYRIIRGKDRVEFKKEAHHEVNDAPNDREGLRDRVADPGLGDHSEAGISDQSPAPSGDAGMSAPGDTDPAADRAPAPVDVGSDGAAEKLAAIGLFAVVPGALVAGLFLYAIILDRRLCQEGYPFWNFSHSEQCQENSSLEWITMCGIFSLELKLGIVNTHCLFYYAPSLI